MTAGGYDPNQYPQGDPNFPNPPQFDNQGVGAQPANVWIRLGARIIDGIIIGIVAFILAAIFGGAGNTMVTGLLTGLIGFVYFVAFDVTQGWTPGKKLLGLSVHGPGGGKPTLQQAAIRESFYLLGIIPFFIGSILQLIAVIIIAVTINSSPTKQGKHDEIAGGTQVLKD